MQIEEYRIPDLPREKLEILGQQKLSDRDLLSILLRTGSKNHPVGQVSDNLLGHFKDLANLRTASLAELQEIIGIGRIKAIELIAMVELGKRIHLARRQTQGQVQSSRDFGQRMSMEMADLIQENLVAVYLDSRNKILQKRTIFVGTVDASPATPREILQPAIKIMATSLIVVHNHPSGDVTPSDADILFTENLRRACGTIGVALIDHLIVGNLTYFSFREEHVFD